MTGTLSESTTRNRQQDAAVRVLGKQVCPRDGVAQAARKRKLAQGCAELKYLKNRLRGTGGLSSPGGTLAVMKLSQTAARGRGRFHCLKFTEGSLWQSEAVFQNELKTGRASAKVTNFTNKG